MEQCVTIAQHTRELNLTTLVMPIHVVQIKFFRPTDSA
jgi:hypothetical protein